MTTWNAAPMPELGLDLVRDVDRERFRSRLPRWDPRLWGDAQFSKNTRPGNRLLKLGLAWGRERVKARKLQQENVTPAGDEASVSRFTGKEEDVEVGLIYFGKRYLNPFLGRWMSADPLAVHSPGSADLNLYAYVRGAVLRAVDPLGLESERLENAVEVGSVPAKAAARMHRGDYFTFVEKGDAKRVTVVPAGDQAAAEAWAESLPEYAQVFKYQPGAKNTYEDAKLMAQVEYASYQTQQSIRNLQTAGLASGGVPVVGDVGSLASSVVIMTKEPSWSNAANVGLDAAGVLPLVPAMGTIRRAAGGVQRASSSALRKALIKAGQSEPANAAAHHIVAGTAKRAKAAQDKLKEFGIGINAAVNGVFLPRAADLSKATVHSGGHSYAYYDYVNDLLGNAGTKEEVLETLDHIRNLLQEGKLKL